MSVHSLANANALRESATKSGNHVALGTLELMEKNSNTNSKMCLLPSPDDRICNKLNDLIASGAPCDYQLCLQQYRSKRDLTRNHLSYYISLRNSLRGALYRHC